MKKNRTSVQGKIRFVGEGKKNTRRYKEETGKVIYVWRKRYVGEENFTLRCKMSEWLRVKRPEVRVTGV